MVFHWRAPILALAFVLVSGCQTVSIDLEGEPVGDPIGLRQNFFLFGVGHKDVNLSLHCGGHPARIQDEFRFTDVLLAAVTFGIYYPRTVWIYCGKGYKGGNET